MNSGHTNARQADVLLISMPFGPLLMPSIGLGLLKAALLRDGISAYDLYFTLDMAARIGVDAYMEVSTGLHSTTDLLGEWIFERELNGQDPVREAAYLRDVIGAGSPDHAKSAISVGRLQGAAWTDALLALRDQAAFMDACVTEVLAFEPKIVGFTSAFQQNVASLALAKRIKAARPDIVLCMGGSNCEGVMAAELMRCYPFLDVVLSGEGDNIFPGVVADILNKRPLQPQSGLHFRQRAAALTVLQAGSCSTPSIDNLDALPHPDYAGFFERFSNTTLSVKLQPHVLFESSRGCYWGAVSHCTFCGLNGGNMGYRAKTADRAMDELLSLAHAYPGAPITVVDNILSMGYFRDFVPRLAESAMELEICYEVKANLTKEQVKMLARAGICAIQPGIESLSTAILRIMKKGCTRLQNVQLLKWCRELGVRPIWNILWGFPGENPADYEDMAVLADQLGYLEPPQVAASLRLDRFSPMFDDAAGFGCIDVRPYPSYGLVYDLPESALTNLAYYFRFGYADGRTPNVYGMPMKHATDRWRERAGESFFFGLDAGECLLLVDIRHAEVVHFHALTGLDRLLYLACDAIQGVASLERALAASGLHATRDEIGSCLQRFVDAGLMLHEGNQWLALAVAPGEYAPPRMAADRAIAAAKAQGTQVEPGIWLVAVAAPIAPSTPDVSAGWLHPVVLDDNSVCLDTRAYDRMRWQETRMLLAGVGYR